MGPSPLGALPGQPQHTVARLGSLMVGLCLGDRHAVTLVAGNIYFSWAGTGGEASEREGQEDTMSILESR